MSTVNRPCVREKLLKDRFTLRGDKMGGVSTAVPAFRFFPAIGLAALQVIPHGPRDVFIGLPFRMQTDGPKVCVWSGNFL